MLSSAAKRFSNELPLGISLLRTARPSCLESAPTQDDLSNGNHLYPKNISYDHLAAAVHDV
jgi:hypothetical protein